MVLRQLVVSLLAALLHEISARRIEKYGDLEISQQQAQNYLTNDETYEVDREKTDLEGDPLDGVDDDGSDTDPVGQLADPYADPIDAKLSQLDLETHDPSRKIEYKNEKLSSDHSFGEEDYDHDAVLGEKQAEFFEQLDPMEAKRRFSLIFSKMDKNKDDFLEKPELSSWIRYVTSKFIDEDVESSFHTIDLNMDSKISWEEIEKSNYASLLGFRGENDSEFLDPEFKNLPETEKQKHVQMKQDMALEFGDDKSHKRDERRFRYADLNNDKVLDKQELGLFLHPEEFPIMRKLMVQEILEDIDEDHDGMVSEEEFIKDLWNDETLDEALRIPEIAAKGKDGEADVLKAPSWISSESQSFREVFDTDSDGFLNEAEVEKWLMGEEDDDNVENEVEHLFKEADDDGDGKLSRHEVVVAHMDLFVGSQVTDYGNVIVKHTEF